MIRFVALAASLLFLAAPALSDDMPKPNTLTPKEIADGWIMLFDGETTFGWKALEKDGGKKPQLTAKDGVLTISGSGGGEVRFATPFLEFEMTGEYRKATSDINFGVDMGNSTLTHKMLQQDGDGWLKLKALFSFKNCILTTGGPASTGGFMSFTPRPPYTEVILILPRSDSRVELRNLKLRPLNTTSLFNGKDLSGWKVFEDPKRNKSVFAVTKDGELSVKNGPGDLQTEKKFDNFVLQLECKTNGKHLNSGIFFRCIENQYQNGYEAQIQNGYIGMDRTKPLDFGTGAIYRRVPARKVVSNDNEWFTMTVVANGPHIATWVNGYQTVDWTDERKPSDNPRQGLRTAAGHLSIQGHDPTTDLLFRNIRIAELR